MLSLRSHVARRRPDVAKMCWSCALKHQRAHAAALPSALTHVRTPSRTSRKALFSSSSRQLDHATLDSSHTSDAPVYNPAIASLDELEPLQTTPTSGGIRDQLRKWHEQHGHEHVNPVINYDVDAHGESNNNFTRLGEMDNFRRPEEMRQDERDDNAQLLQATSDDLETLDPYHRFLRKGDAVLLEFPMSEKEPVLAIFARRVGNPIQSQFYTVHGKWIHAMERNIQHAILGFVEPSLVDPIFPFLPDAGITEDLLDRAQMFDLSVPRQVSAPLVTRMLEFQRRGEEVYRQNASTLDSAHQSLAHPTDLKFGTLELITTKLLGKAKDDPPSQEQMYAVRSALHRAGFAFGHDRRSHRLTGFIQIRSKEQVANVEKIRNWLRAWQDDLAIFAAGKSPNHKFSKTSQYVVDFIHKAQTIVQKSREYRDVTPHGRLGPSKHKFEINDGNLLQYRHTVEFSEADRELIKFLESWACSGLFLGLPRVEALPPLILQATGMYDTYPLDTKTGFTFLQEIGVLSPHENRIRFDSHLLLPSSQHSKPLEHLMSKIMGMRDTPGFEDSMSHLRKDWGDLPVFCIDGESAHEIDDGISVEDAGDGGHWVHVHIANPTAFFDHNNSLAKMARHMTETIYMPERPYPMLPRWSTTRHFSLQANRPCLTFSARINAEGETLEHKVQSGFVRNVKFITPGNAARIVGVDANTRPDVVLRVGGEPPVRAPSKTGRDLSEDEISMLKQLQTIAEKRQANRRLAGGLFLDTTRPEISIWGSMKHTGLGWEHPSRTKARFVEGDPMIEFRTKEFISWFSTTEGDSDILVRELMLLACEIGAQWCAERNIPVIYRGTVDKPDAKDAGVYYKEVLASAIEKNNGEAPMHLAIEYLRNAGSTVLVTKPLHHRILGLPFYSKATSPLRRYGDMILHWQIEAAMRAEDKAGKKLDFSGNPSALPFSSANLALISNGLQPRETVIRRAMVYAEQHWLASLFFRAHYYNECELPPTFMAHVNMEPGAGKTETGVVVKEYSITATMQLPHELGLGKAYAGDTWECVISEVDSFNRTLLLKPIRLVDRWEA